MFIAVIQTVVFLQCASSLEQSMGKITSHQKSLHTIGTYFIIAVFPLLGSEFLIPVRGFFCQLCEEFFGDPICAEAHVTCHSHNERYKVTITYDIHNSFE